MSTLDRNNMELLSSFVHRNQETIDQNDLKLFRRNITKKTPSYFFNQKFKQEVQRQSEASQRVTNLYPHLLGESRQSGKSENVKKVFL